MHGRLESMKYLKDQEADVNAKDNDGITPMHRAAVYGHLEVIKWLKEADADVNVKDNEGMTPLDLAYQFEKHVPDMSKVIEWLKENGAVTGKE